MEPSPQPRDAAAVEGWPSWVEVLDHTADAGFVVRATTLPELFSRAAWALFAVITDVSRVQSGETHPVTVEAVDEPALLVRWLSELNYRHVTRHELYAEFEIQALSPNRLVALVRGEPIDLQRHTLHTEVKAVTFHGLQIDHDAAGWRAQVILDL